MSFLMKKFDGHAGVCVLNRPSSATTNPWVFTGGTFTPLSVDTSVTLEGGFRYFVTWNWASSNTTTGIIQRIFTVVPSGLTIGMQSTPILSRPTSSDFNGFYQLQTHEASIVFDAPANVSVTMGGSYECPSSSLLIWRFPL
jgi:hypothetical protein